MKEKFNKLAQRAAEAVGSPWAFSGAITITIFWAATGSYFHYSDTWQLVINTGTSVATFLIVFLIQNTQNRDARVIHLEVRDHATKHLETIESSRAKRNQ